MSIDLTGWKIKGHTSSMCGKPELVCPVYNIAEYFMGHHWAEWTTDKVDIPFDDQINTIVKIMEDTYSDTRPGFAFSVDVVKKFKRDALKMKKQYCGQKIVTTWM